MGWWNQEGSNIWAPINISWGFLDQIIWSGKIYTICVYHTSIYLDPGLNKSKNAKWTPEPVYPSLLSSSMCTVVSCSRTVNSLLIIDFAFKMWASVYHSILWVHLFRYFVIASRKLSNIHILIFMQSVSGKNCHRWDYESLPGNYD